MNPHPVLSCLLAIAGLLAPMATVAEAAEAQPAAAPAALREAFADDFLLGVAVGASVVSGKDPRAASLTARHFSALTAENAMKWANLQPQPGKFHFPEADAFAAFAEKHRMALIGHTLVWHQQTPAWVFQNADGQPASRDQVIARLRTHIHTVVGRYKGRVKGWDVVNEALSDQGDDPLRDTPWRRIIGDDFIELAFRFAREADPAAELYYNDYGLENPRKRANAVALLKRLRERGVPITGVGTQSHFHLDSPDIAEVEKTITTFASLGFKVMITELDVDVLPRATRGAEADLSRRENSRAGMDPYRDGLSEEIQKRLADRYEDLFRVYLRHRQDIDRVTFWGLHDGNSWLNHFPIRDRVNHPLLFDRNQQPKPAYFKVLVLGQATTGK